MKYEGKKVISVLLLLSLYLAFFAGNAFFYHSHYSEGKVIHHSHPFTGSPAEHSHAQSDLALIDQANAASFLLLVLPVFSGLFSLKQSKQAFFQVFVLARFPNLSPNLRAPPAYF